MWMQTLVMQTAPIVSVGTVISTETLPFDVGVASLLWTKVAVPGTHNGMVQIDFYRFSVPVTSTTSDSPAKVF